MIAAPRTRRVVLLALLVIGLPVAAVAARVVLEEVVAGRGAFVVAVVAAFVAARLGGWQVALGTTVTLVILTIARAGPTPVPAVIGEVGADAVAAGAAALLGTALGLVARGSSGDDETRRDEAARTVRAAQGALAREAAIRDLAEELAGLTSPRQIGDAILRGLERVLPVRAGVVVLPEDSDAGSGRDIDALGVSPALAARGDEATITALIARADVAGSDDSIGVEAPVAREAGADPSTLIRIPLRAGGTVAGVAVVTIAGAAPDTEADRSGLLALGRVAGDALARTADSRRARRSAEREGLARERVGRLQRLAADLARPLEADAAAAVVVDAASAGVGAPVVVLYRVVPARERLELLAARGYPGGLLAGESRLPLDALLPAPEAARSGTRIEVTDVDWARRFPAASDIPAITGLRALVAIPAGEPSPTAVLVVGRAGSQPFDPDELGFLGTIAEQGAQAVERADLLEALRERGRRLDLTLGAARTGTWEVDLDTGALTVSAEFRRVHGLSGGDRLPTLDAYLARILADDRPAVAAAIRDAAARLADFAIEYRTVADDGRTAWISTVGRSFADDGGGTRRITATDRDVTLDRLAEAERERLLEQEREARRLQEAFVGVMSHELRTPITTILAGAKLLLRRADIPGPVRDLLGDVDDEAERLYRLVEDLLVLSRLERGNLAPEREPVHLGHLVERVVASEQQRWPSRSFRVERPRRDEVVEGEDTYVEQALRNLLSNAAKYSPPGSTVEVLVEHGDGEVHVRVLDEGPGIAAEEMGDLFTLFYRSPTTAAAASGAGIGLFVCDRLVRAMGGRIWVRPRERRGTEFGFALARYDDAEPASGDDGVHADAARIGRA